MTAHRLTPRQLAAVYRWLRRDFPLAERKPLWMMLISQRHGRYEPYVFWEKAFVRDIRYFMKHDISILSGGVGPWAAYATEDNYFRRNAAKSRWQIAWLCGHFMWDPDDDPDTVILNNNLQGLFWISPPAGCYPAIRRLIERRFPVVCIAMPYDSYHPVLEQNMILRNYASSGETLARFFHENALSNPVYCGLPNLSFERFVSGLRHYGITFNPENLIAEPGEIERKLPLLIEKNGIDSIASDGGFARYNIITKLLSAHPDARRIALVMERSADTLHYRNDYPNLNIKLNSMDTISDYMCRAGTRAGEMFQKLIRHPGAVCNSIAV